MATRKEEETKKMNIREKLTAMQTELKAPKGQYNSYGKYKYRSCEDILEALKPLLKKYNCSLVINDEVAQVGERYYIKATATIYNNEELEQIGNTAYARESLDKKGMDDSQITGTASSYARKYCLNGLFLIDDTKDADTDEYRNQQDGQDKQPKVRKATDKQIEIMKKIAEEQGGELDEEAVKEWTIEQASAFIEKYRKGNK